MGNELRLLGETTGSAVYAVIVRHSDELIWNGTAFVTRVNANQATYAVSLTETPSGSQVWLGNFPTGIIDDGTVLYHVDYYLRSGGSPVYTDLVLGGENMYSDGSNSVLSPSTSALITVAEYDLVVDNTFSASAKSFLIQAATTAIENYLGRKLVTFTSRTEVCSGTGFGYLQLDGVPSSVTSVTVNYQESDEKVIDGAQFNWTTDGVLYPLPSSELISFFPAGHQNIKVIYSSNGTVDYALKQACISVVMAMTFLNDGTKYTTEMVNKDQKMRFDTTFLDGVDPVFGEARSLLAPYKHFLVV